MIIITATISTTPPDREAIIALCAEHSARSRAEPGCISHHIHADCEDPSRLFFHEEWLDAAAVAAHFAKPDARDFVRQLTALAGHRPDMQIYQAKAISAADLV
ncbi:MAG: antibiotic biosynthesis monooxygenase [Pseudomonadota bacterium]